MSQHLRGVHVLPPAFADIYGTDFIVTGHQPNSISQAAILKTIGTGRLRSLEIVEDFEWANKQTDVNRIVIAQVFPDGGHQASSRLDFHGIVQIENGIEFSIQRHVKETRSERIKQALDNRVLENMVAHREDKRVGHAAGSDKKRDAILFSPIAVFDE